MNDDFLKKIKNDIEKTGFPTELFVQSVLSNNGWGVINNMSFLDREGEKSREFDIRSHKMYRSINDMFLLQIVFLAEVKKSKEKPWVIFANQNQNYEIGFSICHSAHNFIKERTLTSSQISEKIPRANHQKIGSAYYEGFKDPDKPSQIFNAIISACKAAHVEQDGYRKTMGYESIEKITKYYDPIKRHEFFIFIPLIIFDGVLVESSIDHTGEMVVETKNFIPVDFRYSSPFYPSDYTDAENQYNISKQYYVDVITVDGIENYLELVEEWANSIVRYAGENMSS